MKKYLFISASITLLADGLTKIICQRFLADHVIDGSPLIKLYCTRNSGIAFGWFHSLPWIGLIVAPILVALGIFFFFRCKTKPFTQIACGMIIGGFFGNWLERLLFGSVLDMITFPFLPFFVCNIADIAICFGMAEVAVSLLFDKKDWVAKEASHLDNK